jgi:hypothetical protein
MPLETKGKPLRFAESLHSLLNPLPQDRKGSNVTLAVKASKKGLFSKNKSTQLSFHSHIQASVEKDNFSSQAQNTVTDFRCLLVSKQGSTPGTSVGERGGSQNEADIEQHAQFKKLSEANQSAIRRMQARMETVKRELLGSKSAQPLREAMEQQVQAIVAEEMRGLRKCAGMAGGRPSERQGKAVPQEQDCE